MYTDYGWRRIGVLNNRPLFACQYFAQARATGRIYHHKDSGGMTSSGRFAALPVRDVPAKVLRTWRSRPRG